MTKLKGFLDGVLKLITEGSDDRKFSCLMAQFDPTHTKEFRDMIETEDLHEYGKEEDAHVTIKYGIHTNDSNVVMDFVGDVDPISLEIHNVSLFENEEFDVIKLDVKSSDLKKMNKTVSDEFDHTDSYPNYHPHSTIAYVKNGLGEKYIEMYNEKFPNFSKKIESKTLKFSTPDDQYTLKKLS